MMWCITEYKGGYVGYSPIHKFVPYNTLILRRPMYYCSCGKRITPEEYKEYLVARDKIVRNKNK